MADPTDIADVCLFLASPLARYVTGAEVLVHGGGEKPGVHGRREGNRARLMRIVVFGAGAVGGVIGGRLFEHGHDVVADRARRALRGDPRPRAAARRPDREVTLPIPVVDDPAARRLARRRRRRARR